MTETPPLTPVEAPLDHTEARSKAQLEKMQEAFAENLVDAFNTLVLETARVEGSTLATLTIGQMDELMDCLHTTVTTPPPEWTKTPFAFDKDRDNPLPEEPT